MGDVSSLKERKEKNKDLEQTIAFLKNNVEKYHGKSVGA
jgi:hypothetical protein